ncbi:MAG TPA: fumarylacetoacetate hydrolase family protein [Actinomycetota bacterium]|nr:fumarylacetoacetate hydrolase family protein [Actinomycetota bacterium]
MKIFRYRSRGQSQVRLGIAAGDQPVQDLQTAWSKHVGVAESTDGFLTSTLALIEGGPELWRGVDEAVRAGGHDIPADVEWVCPLDRLSSLRDFLAFEDHVKRGAQRRGANVPDYWHRAPVYYKGNHRSIIGPDEECPWPPYTQHLDFELELGMIVGAKGRDITKEDADRFIFGFTILDDFSARDIQAEEMTAWLGPAKGKDFATALGPCIVTADEVGPQPDLEMICRVNGEQWGRARSSDARWSWAEMIAHVSRSEDVYPGDVYGSGTPGGCCGLDLGRRLSAGDVVELEVESLGVLRNRIATPA